jgi:predicted ArsR family transcriptional regulator
MTDRVLTPREVEIIHVLRQHDELWVTFWEIAKLARLTVAQARGAVTTLRRRHLIARRRTGRPQSGRATVFLSLDRGTR